MQVNNIAPITLIYPTIEPKTIYVYEPVVRPNTHALLNNKFKFERPTAFKWPDSYLRPVTPKLINWLQTDFKKIFNYDPIMWMASVATVDPELQPYLKDLFNE